MRLSNKRSLVTGGAQDPATPSRRRSAGRARSFTSPTSTRRPARRQKQNCARRAPGPLSCRSTSRWRPTWQQAVKQIEDETGGLDILVSNAGINIRKVIEEISAEELDQMYNIDVKGPFLGIKYALPVMKKIGGGSIINMSSVCGLIGHMCYAPEAYDDQGRGVAADPGGSLALRQVQHPLQFDQSEHGRHAAGA